MNGLAGRHIRLLVNEEGNNNFTGKRISVIGAARSGTAAAAALTSLGANVLLSDSKSVDKFSADEIAVVKATGAEYVFSASVEQALPEGVELVVTSPGVPVNSPVLASAKNRRIEIWSEIELAYRLSKSQIIAITGTNGKSSTTLLIAAMLEASGLRANVCGNISADEIKKTLVEAAMQSRELPWDSMNAVTLVAEISSFQLEWVEQFAPKVAIITNITPDHLNRYNSFEEYAETKARILAAQDSDDWAILNYDDPITREIGMSPMKARRIWFTGNDEPPDAEPVAWVNSGILTIRMERNGKLLELLPVSEMPPALPGKHSVANVLMAGAAALAVGADPKALVDAVQSFRGVPHRMEIVADVRGVRFINNSMCTNIAASICSLNALDRPTIVIAGGVDKGLDFSNLTPSLHAHAKHLILIGEAADKMETAFRAAGYTSISRADSLEEAVYEAARLAVVGDAVLLSPACASFDMFRDFEARGEAFRQAARKLREE